MKNLFFLLVLLSASHYCLSMEKGLAEAISVENEYDVFVRSARVGEFRAVQKFVAEHPDLINVKSIREERTALHSAARGYLFESNLDCYDIFDFLLTSGANPEIMDKEELTVEQLIKQIAQIKNDSILFIAERAATLIGRLHRTLSGPVGHTLAPKSDEDRFHIIARSGDTAALKEMLAKNPVLLNMKKKKDGKTALFIPAIGYLTTSDAKYLTFFAHLLSCGASLAITDKHDRTVTVKAFIQHKTDKFKSRYPGMES